MKMENKNFAKKPYSWGSHLPPILSNDGRANFVSTFFFVIPVSYFERWFRRIYRITREKDDEKHQGNKNL